MSEPGNPDSLDEASALEAGIPPRGSSLCSFTVYPERDTTTLSESPSPRSVTERLASSSARWNSHNDLSYVTWTPPATYVPPLPPSPSRPAQAVLAINCRGSPNTKVNEPFPAFIDPANNLINARTLLLDVLHRRSVSSSSTSQSPSHPDKQHFNSLFSRISPQSGHIKTDEDLNRTKVDLSVVMASGKALREKRGSGNAGKVVHFRTLEEPAVVNETTTLHKNAEPKQLLRRKMRARANLGIATALKFEREFGIGFLHRRQASSDLRRQELDPRGRARPGQPRRPPGVTREEVALSLSMLRESFPGLYDIVRARHSSLAQHGDTAKSSTRPKKQTTVTHQINGIGLQGTLSSRSFEQLPSASVPETMKNPISFQGQQYASLRVVEPTRRSNARTNNKTQPRSSAGSTAHCQPVNTLHEESAQYFHARSSHPSQGGEYTQKSEVKTKTSKVRAALKKVSSMLKAFAKGVGLRPSSTKSSKQEKKQPSDAEPSRNALRSRTRHVDSEGQQERITGKRMQSTSRLVTSSSSSPSSSATKPHWCSTSRSTAPDLVSTSQSSRYYASSRMMNAKSRVSMERPVTRARVVTVQQSRPQKLKKNRKVEWI
ncbi:hypothetical protein RBB50_000457 [Rhinocladiella similis]